MTFKDVTTKNFKVHVKKYLSYFLCSSFSIMLFFMYSTLLFNKNIRTKTDYDLISFLFYISMAAVGVFAVFFINYAHTTFIKSRYKEFALYLTLGMTQKDVQRIIVYENVVIILASLFSGLASGFVFSRLFQMIVIRLLGLGGISYSLSYNSFLLTIFVFAAIFSSVIVISRFSTRNLEISELLKKSRQGEGGSEHRLLPVIAGILLIVISFIMLYFIANDKDLNTNIIAIISFAAVSFSGCYIVISNTGKAFMAIIKRNNGMYYRNILTITEINHRFNQNKRVIFILTILSSMIVFFVGAPFALLKMTENISGINQPNHIEYAEISGVNRIADHELDRLLQSSKTPLVEKNRLEFIMLNFDGSNDKYDALHIKPIISLKLYNSIVNTKLVIPKGHIMNIITAWEPGYHGILPDTKVVLANGSDSFEFKVLDSIHGKWVTGGATFPSSSGIVMNDTDYAEVRSKLTKGSIGSYHIMRFKDWKKTETLIDSINKSLKTANQKSIGDNRLMEALSLVSRLNTYKGLKQGYSMFIFVTTIMGILFFIAAGSVLYFKQYTELGSTKVKFLNLYKLGILDKEVSEIISKELRVTFFTPLIFGSILGYAFMYLVTNIVGGQEVLRDFMISATYVVIAYFIFQAVFYFATKRKFISEILDSM